MYKDGGFGINKNITFTVDSDVYEKFNIALGLSGESSVDIAGEATLIMMERLCSDKERPELYVPTFRNNYAQMKLGGPKSHGKVFEDDGERVWIWDEAEETLMKYKDSFYAGEE